MPKYSIVYLMIVIYQILNIKNSKFYIGSAKNFKDRKRRHLQSLRNGNHFNAHLQRSFNKYGENNFEFLILEELENIGLLIEKEQFWIDNLNPYYNICKVANSSIGIKRRKETIEKIRKANLGLKHPKWRNEIKSKSQSGENHWTKKKSFSFESKQKMSKSQKNLYLSGYENPNKKKIKQYTLEMVFIREYISITEASKQTGIERRAISHCINKKSKSSGGFIWL